MNIFIMLAILFANLIAISLVYQFVKKLPKMEKIIFIVVSFAFVYIGVTIANWFSGFGIETRVNDALKAFITYIFVPVDVILLIPFIATKYSEWKQNKIDKSELIKRVIVVVIIGIIILTIESIYFNKIKENVSQTIKSVQLDEESKEQTNIILENQINDTNEILEKIENVEITNTQTQNKVNNKIMINTINENNLE